MILGDKGAMTGSAINKLSSSLTPGTGVTFTKICCVIFNKYRMCPCEVACQERTFESTASVATWPSNQVGDLGENISV